MMKDEITLNFNFNILKEQCNICFKQNHLSDECVKTHYVPDKDFLIKKNNYSAYQQRGHNKLPVKLLTKKFNVLAFKMDDSPLNNSNRLSGFSNYNEEMKLNKKTTSDISLKTEEQLIIDLSMPNVI